MKIVLAVMVALVVAAAGCEPFETELTLNANGSGTMKQKATLSAGAKMFVTQWSSQQSGWRPVLTEAEARKWTEANADTGIRIVSFSATENDEGLVAYALELTFTDLQRLAESVWAWPMRIGLQSKDHVLVLQLDDPVRAGFKQSMKMIGDNPERRAMEDILSGWMRGLRSRVAVSLPVEATKAEGASLQEDRRSVVYEYTADGGIKAFRQWIDQPTVALELPANALKIPPFAVPETAPRQPNAPSVAVARAGRDTPGGEATTAAAYAFSLSSVTINRSRSIRYQKEGTAGAPTSSEGLSIQMQLAGPEGRSMLLPTYAVEHKDRPVHMLSALKDSDGNDLRTAETRIDFNHHWGWPHQINQGNAAQMGWLNITISKLPATKALALIEGYCSALMVEEKSLEIRPLKDNLHRSFDLGLYTLTFTGMQEHVVEYVVTRKADAPRLQGELRQIRWLAGDSKPLRNAGNSTRSRDGDSTTHKTVFEGAFPEDGYASINYVDKVEEVRIPFSCRDVKVP